MVSLESAWGGCLGSSQNQAYVCLHAGTRPTILDESVNREAVLSGQAAIEGRNHLLRHYSAGQNQEELCFGLWHQSTGATRKTAIIYKIIHPKITERGLHGNASFEPDYLARSVRAARKQGAGLAFMHSHPTSGWQDMSIDDVVAERDVISYPARATKMPLVGLTIGRDGYWSARWWESHEGKVKRFWCDKVRVVGQAAYEIFGRPDAIRANGWSSRLRRTEDSWGPGFQSNLEGLNVGVVGVGSVGSIVAEALVRIGVGSLTLIDGDTVEEHNLDRLLHGSLPHLGKKKTVVVAEALRKHATNSRFVVYPINEEIHYLSAYRAALDCDIIFSCVDRPVGRDVLNYIAKAHLIPVVDGGVAVEAFRSPRRFFGAHWRAHVVTPEHECLRCAGQYSSGDVVSELDGSLSDPAYIKGLEDSGARQNMNTFPFALGAASLQVNLALRYLLGASWWPLVSRQEHQFIKGVTTKHLSSCEEGCVFPAMAATGDASNPPFLRVSERTSTVAGLWSIVKRACTGSLNRLRQVR